ncbi:conserved hypothetical protein [Methanocella paludicola SANAE]|uniref:VWFA domain-containing protein n=1 Tax=Methanocella paludicola (strain DSM 17711 / JCM 13418 / NBRC 101707 / SANAE) TaxID=304371 RepID=D1YX59_METPS|nr:vWA domain-containing protein [Methanocella paludicola]BAI61031.1 conserved hypothetical protein [Methanocella paludicola SANAE]
MTKPKPKSTDKKAVKTGDITEIVVILDRSGSMSSVIDDAIGGFNTFLEKQQADPDPAWFTLVQFNDRSETVCSGIDIRDAKPYDRKSYVPSGNTALLDAVGQGINDVLQRPEDSKSKVLFAILTDGQENSSREFTREQIQRLIKMRQEAGWEFVYLGVGLEQFDAERAGAGIGIHADKVAIYMKSKMGIDLASEEMHRAVMEYKRTGKLDKDEWKRRPR